MLSKYTSTLLFLCCLMHSYASNAQVYAPDTTFKQYIIPVGEKIIFLHKIDEVSYFIGTNFYDDGSKPLIKNLFRVNLNGEILSTHKDINCTLVDAKEDKILLTNIDGTFLFENQKLRFIDKRKAFDVNWNNKEILLNEKGKVKVINFEGNEKYNLQGFPFYTDDYGLTLVIFQNNNSLTAYYNDRILHFDYNGNEITPPVYAYIPNTGTSHNSIEFVKINSKYLGINKYEHGFEFPSNAHTLTLIDSIGKLKSVGRKKIIGTHGSNIILRTNEYGSKYNIVNENFEILKGRTIIAENLRKTISFDDFYVATDGKKVFKLSTKNIKYIEVILSDTVEINTKPILISAKVIGSNEKVNIACDCPFVENNIFNPKKAGTFKIDFKTNSGLVLNKTITIKKRIDSISFTGFRDIYLTELPLKYTIKSKSGLPVKYFLGPYTSFLFFRNDELINRRLPLLISKYQYEIYFETEGNDEFESSKKKFAFEIKDTNEIINFKNPSSNFVLYPTPIIENKFKVLYTGKEFISNPRFKLLDNFGREIEISQVNEGNDYVYQLSTASKIQPGIYSLIIHFYSFALDNDVREVKRVIVR
ncbi:hypothetical protein [Emticicia sp.]|uniref:hypothetical protein n=1 Tax=Emticicia sp. TaxID=1930953 RepID=UPI003751B61F